MKKRIYLLLIQRADIGNSDGSDMRRDFQNAAAHKAYGRLVHVKGGDLPSPFQQPPMKLLLIGHGYLGQAITREFREHGWEVTAVSLSGGDGIAPLRCRRSG